MDSTKPTELKDTLNLPITDFSMRADLVKREPARLQHWEKLNLYQKIQEKNSTNPAFILHDGPPFTNGDIHLGTALNKILKDTILRYKSMRGFRTPYLPGWDCHGLPIEYKVIKKLQEEKKSYSTLDLRKACSEFSEFYIQRQKSQFQRLGVLADWQNEYKTKNPSYEASILQIFSKFVQKGLVYRSKKPVYWSIPCTTALAESEIEYHNHTSPSVYVKFKLNNPLSSSLPSYVLIWTTTPWTIPANLAIAVNPLLDYQEIITPTESLLVAKDRVQHVLSTCNIPNHSLGQIIQGKNLENTLTQHPFINRSSPIVLADYVTLDSGTGCVHTAPGHGLEDYQTGLKYNLDIYSPIDDHGRYINDGLIPSSLVGKSVLFKQNRSEANDAVLDLLKSSNSLLHIEPLNHQYPFCWRSKTPVIFRAMHQWFIKLDHDSTRSKVLDAISHVQWVPSWGENRIRGSVSTRPDWCISRQRAWGVPLPIFYGPNNEILLEPSVINLIAEKIKSHGTDYWFEASSEELLSGIPLPDNLKSIPWKKGSDTIEVWIESGSSHFAVLNNNPSLHWPADLYLEGSDQHRGWFQSSLWTSIIALNAPPFKSVITHGFVVNEDKKKISKSDDKTKSAEFYINQYGADILRLWIASEDFKNDIPLSDTIINHVVQSYRTIRNTLRFQLGNLHDFNPTKDSIPFSSMTPIDQWALHHTTLLVQDVTKAFDAYEFHKAYQSINKFCSQILSATYHDILKDRLYTHGPSWHSRRSSQSAIYIIADTLIKLLAPFLTFSSDEAFSFFSSNSEYTPNSSVHLQNWPTPNLSFLNPSLDNEFNSLFSIRSKINEKLEEARQNKLLGQSLDAHVTILLEKNDSSYNTLKKYQEFLEELFIVSQVSLLELPTPAPLSVSIDKASGVRCPRSWRWVPKLVQVDGFGQVSERCALALSDKYQLKSPNPHVNF